MKPIVSRFGISRRVLLSTLALLPAFQPRAAMAQQAPPAAGSAFSFAVYGDSRPMMYLPYKEGQPELNQLFVEMFGLVMPEKVAEAVVKRYVKTIFDPVTKELVKVDHAVRKQVRSHDVDGGQGMGHRGLGRGRETASRRAPDDVPTARGRMGGARNREGRQIRACQIRGEQRRCRLVGKSGPHGCRQPVLEARERHHVEAAAAGGQRDARGRVRGSVVHGGGQSRGLGRSEDRGRAGRSCHT